VLARGCMAETRERRGRAEKGEKHNWSLLYEQKTPTCQNNGDKSGRGCGGRRARRRKDERRILDQNTFAAFGHSTLGVSLAKLPGQLSSVVSGSTRGTNHRVELLFQSRFDRFKRSCSHGTAARCIEATSFY
jgi:hypothetical protein